MCTFLRFFLNPPPVYPCYFPLAWTSFRQLRRWVGEQVFFAVVVMVMKQRIDVLPGILLGILRDIVCLYVFVLSENEKIDTHFFVRTNFIRTIEAQISKSQEYLKNHAQAQFSTTKKTWIVS